jgi:hypothetical protein
MGKQNLALSLLLVATAAFAQVTISTEDLAYEIGESYKMYNIPSPHGVIGMTGIQGGPHVFDFSEGSTADDWLFEYVDVTDGGHNADFPAATIAERKTSDTGTAWLYMNFESGVGRTNYGFYDDVGMPESPSVPFNPAIVDFPDGISYQSFFEGSTNFQVTTTGVDLDIDYEFIGFADAYGTIILPDGLGVFDCVQVNYEEQYTFNYLGVPIQYSYIRSYYYLVEELGIAAIIISREDENPVPNDFNIANAIARLYDSSKLDTGTSAQNAPAGFALSGNYPNPFNPKTTIRFDLPTTAHVRLNVYDTSGRLVDTVLEGSRSAGSHEVIWSGRDRDGKDFPSGVYYYRLDAGTNSSIRKMVLMK